MEDYKAEIKRRELQDMMQEFEDNGKISWSEFYSDSILHRKKVVEVYNNDFSNGTLRITQPCVFRVMENISFNPNRPTTWLDSNDSITSDFSKAVKIDPNRLLDWKPNETQSNNTHDYMTGDMKFAYSLGFFAAITVESKDVIIDINGFSIEQHKEHYLQQRFFSVIELADQPFISNQGPANFGKTVKSANNCLIMNGNIGLSSHHGIHGNNCNNLYFENLNFANFEVAAISINGSHNIWLRNCKIIGNNKSIPVLGTYSGGRFLRDFVEHAKTISSLQTNLITSSNNLENDLNETFNEFIFNNGTTPSYIKNISGLIDGNTYGILFNPEGVAVESPLSNRDSHKANEISNVYMENVSINGIDGNIVEVLGIINSNGSVVDTAGSLLRWDEINNDGKYNGTNLSDTQIELARYVDTLDDNTKKAFGTLNIDKGIMEWKDNEETYLKVDNNKLNLYYRDDILEIDGIPVSYDIICNRDTMSHINKGVIGFKIDGVNSLYMCNCQVNNISNDGVNGSEKIGSYLYGSPQQTGSLIGYNGDKTYGFMLSAINDAKINNTYVTDIRSKYSSAVGFCLQNNSHNVTIKNIKITDINSSVDIDLDISKSFLPNLPPNSKAIYISSDTFNIKLKQLLYSNINNNQLLNIYNPVYIGVLINSE